MAGNELDKPLADLLEEFTRAGGTVFIEGLPDNYDDGVRYMDELFEIMEKCQSGKSTPEDFKSALTEAIKNGFEVDFTTYQEFDWTLLHFVMSDKHYPREIAKALLEAGADPNRQNMEGRTPLHFAYRDGSPEDVELLKQYGASEDIKDSDGRLPADAPMSQEEYPEEEFMEY